MSRRVLGKGEVSEGQKIRTLNIILLLLAIASTVIGIQYTIGTYMVLLPIMLGGPAVIIAMLTISFLYKK